MNTSPKNILVVDDDDTLRLALRAALSSAGHTTHEASNGVDAIKIAQSKGPFDIALLDVNMPKMNGLDALTALKELDPSMICIMLTAFSNIKDAVQAIKVGAFDYLSKPISSERILRMIDSAHQANALVQAVAHSSPVLQFDEGRVMIGNSSSIQHVFNIIHRLSNVETAVLVRGESGTGKELVARAIHYNSNRRKGPLVAVNCAAIPENLIESELFGHEKGSFTGADKKKIGKFQFAHGGTLFLDEIGDISLSMQVKLLRALQEKMIIPVGGNKEIKVDVRIIAATNRPLEEMIAKETFRSDLFYRLNVYPVNLPPLRDRREDIGSLTDFMITKFNNVHKRKIKKISKDALARLRVYSWPGNIRELENAIEHAFIIEASNCITESSLPSHLQSDTTQSGSNLQDSAEKNEGFFGSSENLNYPNLKDKFEREFIIRALKAFEGRINKTAEHTKMAKVTLLRKIEKYSIKPSEFKNLN